MFPSTKFHANRELPALEASSSAAQTHAPSKKNYPVSPDTIFNSSSLEKLFSGDQLFFNNEKLRASYEEANDVIRLCSNHPKYGKYFITENVWLTKENPLAEVTHDTLQLLIKENLFLPEAERLSSQAPAQLTVGSSTTSAGNASRVLKTDPATAITFTNKVILKHVESFLEADSTEDTGQRSKAMAAAMKKLNDGIALLRQLTDGTGLMDALESIQRACGLFCKAPPCEQVDVEAAMLDMLNMTVTRAKKPSVATPELVEWCRQCVAAIQALYDIADHAHNIPGLPPAMASKVEKELCGLGLRQLATGLCENADQLTELVHMQYRDLGRVNSPWQLALDKKPSTTLLLEALSSTEISHSNAIHLTQEASDFATLIRYVGEPFGQRGVDDATFECVRNAGLKSREIRTLGSRLALRVHLDRLKLLAAAASTLRDPVMKELASVAGQAEHVQSGIDSYAGRSKDFTKGVRLRLLEHLIWQCHDVEVNLRHTSSQLSANTLLQLNTAAIDTLSKTADAFGVVKVDIQDILEKIPDQEALSLEEEQHLDSVKNEFFKPYVEESDAAGDLPDLAISAASAGASTEARPAKQAASPSLDWIEDTPLPSTGTVKPSRRRKGKAKTASKAKSTPAASDMQGTTLQRAYARLAEAVNRHPDLKRNALGYAQIQADKARHEVEHPGDNPVSVARVKRYMELACDTLERSASAISEQLQLLRAAKKEIQELEPESTAEADPMRDASLRETDCQKQIGDLRTRMQELDAEAETLGRAQMINIFLAHPTYESYKTLAKWSSLDNSNVALTAGKDVERKPLPPTTVLGFEKPHADFLDVYSITVRTRKSDASAWQAAGRVEFHTHYESLEGGEAPTVGHFKNEIQAGLSGSSVYRGRVPKFELASLANDISHLANQAMTN